MSEFKNENINLKVEKLPGTELKLEIFVSPEATQAAYTKAIKNVSKEVLIPGFRKGKAPSNLVSEKFKSHIEAEWREITLNTSFKEALELIKATPFSRESIKPEIKSLSLEEGSSLIISFETLPAVPEIKPEEFQLKKQKVQKVTDKEIQDRIHELQLHQAKWEDIEDRGVEEGDFAYVDIESLDTPGLMVVKNEPIDMNETKPGKWLYKLLLGKKVGDVLEAMSEEEPCTACETGSEEESHSHIHEETEFKPSRLKITLNSIRKPELPEITTEFATKVGADSIEVLKERVIQSLEKNFKDQAQDHLRAELENLLLDRYSFEIPRSIIKMHEKGAHRKLNEQEIQELTNSYRMYLITEKIAHTHGIQVSEEEIMQEFMVQAYLTPPDKSLIDRSLEPKESLHRISTYLLEKKVKDFLIQGSQDGLKLLD